MITKKEKNSSLLLLINLALGFYGFGIAWMVQLSAYSLWA